MRALLLLFLLLPVAFAQPALLVSNAASPVSSRPARLAPRSLIQARLDPYHDWLLGQPGPPPLDLHQPLTLTIQPEQGPEALAVEILAATTLDVLGVLPADIPLGPATVALTYNEGASVSGTVEIVPVALALFHHGAGSGPAIAQNLNPGSPLELNGLTRPALPGSYVTLWGTGLGNTPQGDVAVWLGGRVVPVQYAGPSPALAGLDQINIFVPADGEIGNGCYVPLRVDVLGELSNPVTVSKADAPGPCAHPLGLSAQQMAVLDAGGSVPAGRIGIYSSIGPTPVSVFPGPAPETDTLARFEQAYALFTPIDAAGVAWASRPVNGGPPGCRLNPSLNGVVGVIRIGAELDAGDKLRLSGPANRVLEMEQDILGFGYYNKSLDAPEPVEDPADLPDPFFTAGEWEVSAPGGADVEEFHLPVRLPAPVEVTNFQELKRVERSAGMTVAWKSDGYEDSDTMLVQISSSYPAVIQNVPLTPLSLECMLPATAGQAIIEPEWLQQLDATAPGATTLLTLSVNGLPAEEARFPLRLTTGETVPGVVTYGLAESFPIHLH